MASIPTILTEIGLADVNTTGLVRWLGTNGEKQILTDIVGVLRERGVYYIPVDAQGNPDTTALALLGANDARLVLVQDLAMYAYNPNGNNPPPGSVNAGGGGVWELLFNLPTTGTEYTKIIGDSVSTTFTIGHNLNTVYPTVSCLTTLTGLPYVSVDPSTYFYSVIDADTITITFTAPIASLSVTAVVKQ